MSIAYRIYKLSSVAESEFSALWPEGKLPEGMGIVVPFAAVTLSQCLIVMFCDYEIPHASYVPQLPGTWLYTGASVKHRDGYLVSTDIDPATGHRYIEDAQKMPDFWYCPPSFEERERARVIDSLSELFQFEPEWRAIIQPSDEERKRRIESYPPLTF